jgi:hypothetical protein
LASPNLQGATGGTICQTTRLRLVWRPPYGHGVRKSSIWHPIRCRLRKAGAIRGWLRQENASAGERTGKEQAHGKASRAREIRRAWREERGRNQRRERSAHRETYLLALANAFACAAEPYSVPHPREEQPPTGCCFPAASSGPPSSRTRAASPLPSLFPTHAGSTAGGQVFPHRLLWSSIEQEQDPSRLLWFSIEQEQDPSRLLQSSSSLE